MAEKKAQETYSDEEAAKRRDEALRRALNMPPSPKQLDRPERPGGKRDR
tara:strand:+ start:452 stop:598 length:147 start_codon:yes stop_codon:yes gene_type:complete